MTVGMDNVVAEAVHGRQGICQLSPLEDNLHHVRPRQSRGRRGRWGRCLDHILQEKSFLSLRHAGALIVELHSIRRIDLLSIYY